jgi:DNA-binding response OmpR family regulator
MKINMNKKVLIIDDDKRLTDLLVEYLTPHGWRVEVSHNPLDALDDLEEELPDIIILDVMLPDIDGFETCRRIRAKFNVPILMLTARGDVTDRVVGLELGADDYLSKPFEPRELIARMQSILRRMGKGNESRTAKLTIGDLDIDEAARRVSVKGKALDLTFMEFELLSLLVRNAGTVLDRDRIVELLKGFDDDSFDRSIDVMISRIRTKLEDDPRSPRFIETVRSIGYRFISGKGNI